MDFNSTFPVLSETLATASNINEPKEVLRNNYKKYNDRISEFAKTNCLKHYLKRY
jgi:hypothetical protein